MSEEPDTTPTTRDTETPTNDAKAPVTDDTDTTAPAKNQRRYTFLSRHISTLRALRISGILAILSAIILFAFLNGSSNASDPPTGLLPGVPIAIFLTLVIWLWISMYNAWRRLIALLFALCSVTLAGFLVHWWWKLYDQTSFKSIFLLSLGLASLGVGLLIATDLLLRGVRNHAGIAPGNTEDPARFAPYRPGADSATTGKRILRGILRFVLILAPTTAVIVANTVANPVTQITAPFPEGPLPDRSTGIRTTLSWTRDVTELLATASGAAGPVILTPEGLTGLNPTDGTTLWTYQRTNATYAKILTQNLRREDFSNSLLNSYLVSSPNGRYVALRIEIPKELVQDPKDLPPTENSEKRKPINNAVTVVVDTLTGRVTTEHPSNINWSLQLTDSAILDGATAYNLDDGKVRWQLEPLVTNDSETHLHTAYSGPAGHSSFIRLGKFPKSQSIYYEKPKCTSESLILISDTDPNNTTTAENIANDVLTCRPVIVNGLTAQYKKALVVELKESGSIQAMQAQETRVVTLDSLAGLEEVNPVDMGKSVGLNVAASHASGTLAAYPVPEDGKIKFYTDSITDFYRGTPTVGTVFDPTVNTATPAGQYPGLAAATVGIALAARDETLLAEVVMRPGDGSAGVSFPLDSRSIPQSLEEVLNGRRIPVQLSEQNEREDVNVINVSGATLATLMISPYTSTGSYSYRLYGLTGDAS